MFVLFCGAWSPDAARADSQCCGLLEDVLGAARAANLNTDEFGDCLDVDPAALSRMKVYKDAGPGILRFAGLPAKWWIAFIGLRAKRYFLRVIDDSWIERVMSRLDFFQVALIDRQMEQKRMAKAELPVSAEERKRA